MIIDMSIISLSIKECLPRGGLVYLFIYSILMSSQVLAEQWYFEPVVSTKFGYDDNTQLSTDNEIGTYTSNITGSALFGVRTEVSDISLSVRMVDSRFDDYSYLNSDDRFLAFQSYIRSELDQFGLDAGYDQVSTRTSEFDYTGYSTSQGYRITKSIKPYWSRSLSERTTFMVDGAYSKATYEDTGATSRLNDYANVSVTALLRYQLTERSSMQTVLGRSAYRSDSAEYDTTSIQFGLDYSLSETFSVNMLMGPSYTKSRIDTLDGEETSSAGKLVNFGFTKEFELTTLDGSFDISESAGGDGKLTKSTRLALSLQHQISDRTTFSLSGSMRKNESGGGLTDSSRDRDYINFGPKLSWKASPWWTISGEYSYQRSEKISSDEGPAESNAVYINLKYVWPKEPH